MEGEVDIKAIEHFSGLLYGNHLGNPVNHVIHERGGASWFRPSPFMSELFLTSPDI